MKSSNTDVRLIDVSNGRIRGASRSPVLRITLEFVSQILHVGCMHLHYSRIMVF
jgi:hypothetical protein